MHGEDAPSRPTCAELHATLGYDLNRDFVPVTLVRKSPLVFGVNPTVAARNLKDLGALARVHARKLT